MRILLRLHLLCAAGQDDARGGILTSGEGKGERGRERQGKRERVNRRVGGKSRRGEERSGGEPRVG